MSWLILLSILTLTNLKQGELKLKDFNIQQEAGGVDKVTVQSFKALVKNRTLEIRFQYTGKGTTSIPHRGVYGPLVSAISVESGMTARLCLTRFYAISFLFLLVCCFFFFFFKTLEVSEHCLFVSSYFCYVDFKPPNRKIKIIISTGAALLGLFIVLAVICYCWWNNYIEAKISREKGHEHTTASTFLVFE